MKQKHLISMTDPQRTAHSITDDSTPLLALSAKRHQCLKLRQSYAERQHGDTDTSVVDSNAFENTTRTIG